MEKVVKEFVQLMLLFYRGLDFTLINYNARFHKRDKRDQNFATNLSLIAWTIYDRLILISGNILFESVLQVKFVTLRNQTIFNSA